MAHVPAFFKMSTKSCVCHLYLIVHQFFLSPGEPGGTRFNDFARLWRDAGHEVRVVASSVAYDSGVRAHHVGLWRSERVAGTLVRRAWTFAHPGGARWRRFASMVGFGITASIGSTTLGWTPDVVIASSPALTAAIPGMFAASRYRCPFVFEVRDLWPESAVTTGVVRADSPAVRAAQALEAEACAQADRVVGVTPAIVDDIVERKLIDRPRTAMIPNGIDLGHLPTVDRERVRERQGWGERFVAIYAGAHGIANNLDQLVEAAALLRHRRDILLVAVGRGPERARLIARSQHLENLVWLDAVEPDAAYRLVAAANASLVLLQDNPTFKTVYPNKMFAAMAAELPVVLGVDGVARQLVTGAHAGVFVPPESPADLAAAIGHLASDPALCLKLGWNGRALVEQSFDRREHARAYLELLSATVGAIR